ncbi:MAG: diguanylate cyclase domain-containing protein [Alphaproteobacteria bacterium]
MNTTDVNLQALSSVLDEYAAWYGELLACLFYPQQKACEGLDKIHVVFKQWLQETKNRDVLDMGYLARIENIHTDLVGISNALVSHVIQNKTPPDFQSFEKLSAVFEEFVNHMRRLEKDSVLEDSGIDVLTGLRSKKTLYPDLAMEMERLARRGKPFCLALARINDYELIVKKQGREAARGYTRMVSSLIKKSMRSFDDGYRMGNGEFVLSLKQADMQGGIAALERLKKSLEGEEITINFDEGPKILTMSCCIAEPLPDDDSEILIANLREDLLGIEEQDKGSVLQYQELSDLERFIQEQMH